MNGTRITRNIWTMVISLFLFLSPFMFWASASDAVFGSGYILGAGDVLEITVWGHPELRTAVQVRPDGYITFPLVGDQLAEGKTASQLAAEIQQQLSAYVVAPSVTIIITEFRTIRVRVLGEVRNPGYYKLGEIGRAHV